MNRSRALIERKVDALTITAEQVDDVIASLRRFSDESVKD